MLCKLRPLKITETPPQQFNEMTPLHPEAETLLAFGRAMEAANLPAFQYLETQKVTTWYVYGYQMALHNHEHFC